MDFNYIDITIVAIILITALIGFMRGFIWMSVFLATWAGAIILAIKYKDELATQLPVKLNNEVAQTGLAALLIFLGVLIIGAILNYLLNKAIKAVGLGMFDRILGTVLGIGLGGLAVTLLIMLLGVTELPDQDAWKNSKFIPKVQEGAAWVKSVIPENMYDYINNHLIDDKPAPDPAVATPSPTEAKNYTNTSIIPS